MFVCCECCVLSGRGLLRRTDHSFRGVLPTVARRCVWSWNLASEKAKALQRAVKYNPRWGVVAPEERKKLVISDVSEDRSSFIFSVRQCKNWSVVTSLLINYSKRSNVWFFRTNNVTFISIHYIETLWTCYFWIHEGDILITRLWILSSAQYTLSESKPFCPRGSTGLIILFVL